MPRRSLLAVCWLLALAPAARAQTPASPAGRVRGTVTDAATGAPVRATVTLGQSARAARTDSAGGFVISDVPAGDVALTAAALGYRPERTTVRVVAGGEAVLQLTLRGVPRALGAVRTTAARSNEEVQRAAPAGAAVVSMTSRELSAIPAVGEVDVLRAVSLLPGVAARNDFWAGFNVRGGESDQTQVRLDGLPVFSPFHLGGLFSTFIADAVQNVDARVGALPASYGGRLSGVLDVTSAEESRPGVHGALDVSAISTAATLGGALPFGTAGTWNVALRRTYVDALADLVLGAGSFPYHFQDAQLHAATQTRGGGTLEVTAYAGLDLLNPTAAGDRSLLGDSTVAFRFDWGNQLAGASFTQPLGTSAEAVQRVAYSRFNTSYADAEDGARLVNHIAEVRLAGDVTRRFGSRRAGGATPTLTTRAGYELALLRTRYDERFSSRAADDFGTALAIDDTTVTQRASAGALFGEALWTPSGRLAGLSVRGGVRAERVPQAAWAGVSPRLAVKYRVRDGLSFSGAAGRYAQWTHAVRNEDLPVRIVDIWFVSDASVPVSTGTELVGGGELWVTPHDFVRVDAYAKTFDDLVEPASTVDPRLRPAELRRFGGTSRGVELLVRHVTTARWGGWLAYSYGRSRREGGGESYFAAHDRRHDANVVASYRLNTRYTFGARLGVASGTPYTGWSGTYARWTYDPITRRWRPPGFASNARNEQVRTPRNTERYPAYSRVDLSAHRAFRLRGAESEAFLNLVNVLNTRNVLLYTIDTEASPPTPRGFSQLPFLPTFGMRVRF